MADDQGQDPTATGQDPNAGQQVSTSVNTATTDTGQDPAPPQADDKDENELRRARDEAAKSRTALKDAQKALKEAQEALKAKDDEGKSEMQKAMDRVAELEAKSQMGDRKVRRLRLQNEVFIAAHRADIVDPDAAFRLLDEDRVEYDGDKPTNVQDLLDDMVKDRPYLKAPEAKTRPAKGGTSPTQPAAPTTGKLTLDDIKAMSDDEINARWEEVKPVLANSKGR